MSDRLTRAMMLMALPYLVVTSFYATGIVISSPISLQAASMAGTLTASLCFLAIWRHYISWTAPRLVLTIGMSALMIVQLIVWQPIWTSAHCENNEILRVSQSGSMLGVWLGAASIAWWLGLRKSRLGQNEQVAAPRRRIMSPDVARLCVAWALVPFLPALFGLTTCFMEDFGIVTPRHRVLFSYLASAIFGATIWLLIWRRRVTWNARRIVVTLFLLWILLLSPCAVLLELHKPAFVSQYIDHIWEVICYLSPLVAAAIWFAGTAWLWRRSGLLFDNNLITSEQIDTVMRCPECTYSLKGLREVRCPECGWSSTIDETVRRSLIEFSDLQSA